MCCTTVGRSRLPQTSPFKSCIYYIYYGYSSFLSVYSDIVKFKIEVSWVEVKISSKKLLKQDRNKYNEEELFIKYNKECNKNSIEVLNTASDDSIYYT